MASPVQARAPQSLIGGLILTVCSILLIGTAALVAQTYLSQHESAEELERARLQAAATVLAQQIDVGMHQRALEAHQLEDHFKEWRHASADAQVLHNTLANAAGALGTSTPILTLRVPEKYKVAVASDPRNVQKNALEIVGSSATTPTWLHPFTFRPEMAYPLLRSQPSATGIYEDGAGSWVSGFAPLLDAQGDVAGMVIISASADGIAAQARGAAFTALVTMLLTTLGVIIASITLSRRLSKNLRALEQATTKMADGDITTPISVEGIADISRVGHGVELARRQVARRVQALTLQGAELRHKLTAAQLQLDPRVLERRERISDTASRIRTSVILSGQSAQLCDLIDLGYEEVVIKVTEAQQLDLSPGMPARLEIAVQDEVPMILPVRVGIRLELDDHIEYRFKLVEPLVDLEELPPGVLALLNTRGAIRIMPSNHAPVLVDIQAPDHGFMVADAAVENLSATGLAVRVPQPSEIVATWGTSLKVHLTLPGHIVPIEYRVRIANLGECIGGSRLGLAFEQEDPGFKQKQEHLRDYVTERVNAAHNFSGELRLAS